MSHTYQAENGTIFHYNSDFSGDLSIVASHGTEIGIRADVGVSDQDTLPACENFIGKIREIPGEVIQLSPQFIHHAPFLVLVGMAQIKSIWRNQKAVSREFLQQFSRRKIEHQHALTMAIGDDGCGEP